MQNDSANDNFTSNIFSYLTGGSEWTLVLSRLKVYYLLLLYETEIF